MSTSPDPRVHQPELNDGTELLSLVGHAYRTTRRRIERVVRGYGVTMAQFAILQTLSEEPGLSGVEVAARAFITPQAAHAALSTLGRKGLLVRQAEQAHRRLVRTTLTDEGARVVNKCLSHICELGVELGAGLSTDKRRRLVGLLSEYVAGT